MRTEKEIKAELDRLNEEFEYNEKLILSYEDMNTETDEEFHPDCYSVEERLSGAIDYLMWVIT